MSNKNPSGARRRLARRFARTMALQPQPRPQRMDALGNKLAAPAGERGSASNPLGPRSRRRAYWTPIAS